jgi:hypothetical protein
MERVYVEKSNLSASAPIDFQKPMDILDRMNGIHKVLNFLKKENQHSSLFSNAFISSDWISFVLNSVKISVSKEKPIQEEAFEFFATLLDPCKSNDEIILKLESFSKKDELLFSLIKTHKFESSEWEFIKCKLSEGSEIILESIFINSALLEQGQLLSSEEEELLKLYKQFEKIAFFELGNNLMILDTLKIHRNQALLYCIENDRGNALQYLEKLDLASDSSVEKCFNFAALQNFLFTLQVLAETIHVSESIFLTTLISAIIKSSDEVMVRYLLSQFPTLSEMNKGIAICHAILYQKMEIAKILLNKPPEIKESVFVEAVNICVSLDREDMIEYLLSGHRSVEDIHNRNYLALLFARKGFSASLDKLLILGPIDATIREDACALAIAAGHIRIKDRLHQEDVVSRAEVLDVLLGVDFSLMSLAVSKS